MDALQYLGVDHEDMLAMLKSLETPPTEGDVEELSRRKLLALRLVTAESQHEAIEEQVFWPAVRRSVPRGDELADCAVNLKSERERLLHAVEHSGPDSQEFEDALGHFIKGAREHIQYEQTRVWQPLRDAVGEEGLQRLGEELDAASASTPTPHA